MSVGDRLGRGSSFGNVPRGGRTARGRAKAVAQGDVPAYELVRLRLDEVSPTPLNPRRNFGTPEEQTRFGEELRTAQLAACVAVTRGAYLKLWPDHEAQISDAIFVLVNGERRYRSAVHVGLEALDFVVRDDLASSREEFVNHLLKENLDREDFDVIERARGVQELVAVCAEDSERGAKTRAAKRLGKDRSWVTNQLALLRLPEEIQAMLSSGDMPERDGRLLARHTKDHPELGAADLIAYLKSVRAEEAQARQEQKAILQVVHEQPELATVTGGGVLSADGPTAPTAPAAASSEAQSGGGIGASQADSDGPLLSADNNGGRVKPEKGAAVPHQASDPPQPPGGSATPVDALLRRLGGTPAEQARTLASHLGKHGVQALIDELRAYV
jgi:ParB family transcriptional regulator, chromosome partitioning protein